jgi:hypothetical protein
MCIMIDSQHRALVESKTGEKMFPGCFNDLVQYHAYLMGSKHPEQAQKVLKRVFQGEKVIQEMNLHARGEK